MLGSVLISRFEQGFRGGGIMAGASRGNGDGGALPAASGRAAILHQLAIRRGSLVREPVHRNACAHNPLSPRNRFQMALTCSQLIFSNSMRVSRVLLLAIMLVTLNRAATAHGSTEQIPSARSSVYSNPKKNLAEFLVEFRCVDPNVTDPIACVASPRMANTIVNWRRTDWGSGGVPYYQVSEDYLSDDGSEILQTFSYAPFGAFNAANGDGGQVSFTDGISVRILGTQDGSVPYFQNFVGPACGGQGWVQVNLKVGD